MEKIKLVWPIGIAAIVCFALAAAEPKAQDMTSASGIEFTPVQKLGRLIFFDRNLSNPSGQSCADCHAPEAGFANPDSSLPVSRGVRRDRFGNRNDLPAAYAMFSPPFHYDEKEALHVGGQFWDGRASTLEEQAKGPFLNPLEMANASEEEVVEKVRRSGYADLFREVFGPGSLDDVQRAYDFIARAIAEFERSPELNRFNSKYDLYLDGKVGLTVQEQRGLSLFEDEKKGNCAACHPSRPGPYAQRPLFTDFTYDNLGVPRNPENPYYYLPLSLNPDGVHFLDLGLGGVIQSPAEAGKFKVPSLRNVALTGPYLHNGVFKTLRQVVVFYNTRDAGPWPPPEVPLNVNREELGNLGLSELEVDDIVAFLLTLTDNYTPPVRPPG